MILDLLHHMEEPKVEKWICNWFDLIKYPEYCFSSRGI